MVYEVGGGEESCAPCQLSGNLFYNSVKLCKYENMPCHCPLMKSSYNPVQTMSPKQTNGGVNLALLYIVGLKCNGLRDQFFLVDLDFIFVFHVV